MLHLEVSEVRLDGGVGGQESREEVDEEHGEEDQNGVPTKEQETEVYRPELQHNGGSDQRKPPEKVSESFQQDYCSLLQAGFLLRLVLPGVGHEAVASLAHHEETLGDQKVLGHLEWFSGDLHEVKLKTQLENTSKEHFCSFQGQHFLHWLIFLSEEEEKVKPADQLLLRVQ